jgi:hypothetical protein
MRGFTRKGQPKCTPNASRAAQYALAAHAILSIADGDRYACAHAGDEESGYGFLGAPAQQQD